MVGNSVWWSFNWCSLDLKAPYSFNSFLQQFQSLHENWYRYSSTSTTKTSGNWCSIKVTVTLLPTSLFCLPLPPRREIVRFLIIGTQMQVYGSKKFSSNLAFHNWAMSWWRSFWIMNCKADCRADICSILGLEKPGKLMG